MTSRIRWIGPALAAIALVVLAISWSACSSSQGPTSSTVQINGAGSTFGYPIYSKWFDVYHTAHPDLEFNYQAIGSGGGIRQLISGTVDFGASDEPMTDSELVQAKSRLGSAVLQLPTVLGAVVPTYNVPGISAPLKFTGEVLADIYLGKIRKWNDPALTKLNPGVKLPGDDIVVVHRSDGSGTTYIWTDYLSKVSTDWAKKVGRNTSVDWPVGLGGKGNQGVTGIIQQTQGAVGYVELIYASQNNIPYGLVQNAAGRFIKADLPSVTAAAAGAAQNMPADFRVSITNAPGPDAYPVSSFTWLLIPARINNPRIRMAVTGFLSWMLKDGQQYAAPLSYAPLPKAVIAKEIPQISKIH